MESGGDSGVSGKGGNRPATPHRAGSQTPTAKGGSRIQAAS